MTRLLHILMVGLGLLLVSGVSASALRMPTETEKASYRVYYAGIPVGKVWLWWEADDQYYKVGTHIKTSGLARMFAKQKRSAEVSGKIDMGEYIPIHYQANVIYPHKQRSTAIAYDDHHITQVIHSPARPDVLPAKQREQAMDPLSALLQLLLFMQEPGNVEDKYASEIFDGKRLMRGYAVPHTEYTKDCMLPCRTYALYRKPISGYSEKELKKYNEGEPPLFITHNPAVSRFPMTLEAEMSLGTIVMERVEEDS